MHCALLPILLILITGNARAEDFTGFYAGLNAGYGWGRDHHGPVTTPDARRVIDERSAGPGLPPSASEASASVRGPDRIGAKTRPGR